MKIKSLARVLALASPLVGCGPTVRTAPTQPASATTHNVDPTLADDSLVLPTENTSTTQPATASAGELLQSSSEMTGYGVESYRLVNEPDEIVCVLRNGMAVITKRVASPVVAARAYVYTGGVYEGKWLGGGLSHLLEHLVAGGSSEVRTEAENRDLLQALGNNSNAYTTTDHTAFFINTTTDRMEQAVDLLAGWMLGAKITVPEYKREYQVVQRELEMGKGEPDKVFYEMTQSNRYRVNPARVPVIGYQEVIQGLSRDDVHSYYKLAYQPNNMVFAVAGNLDPEKMLAAVQKYVKGAKPGREFSRDIPAEPPVQAPRTVVGTFPKLGQARLQLAFPSVKLDDPDLYALDLLASVLGEGESSIFVDTLRDQKQLVSGVNVSDSTPSYVQGSFEIDMELDAEKIPAATVAALELIEATKKPGGIPIERIARAKTQAKAGHVKRVQTAEDIASTLATDFMSTGDPHFADRYVTRIDQVTPERLTAVARKYLNRSVLLTTALLPEEFAGAKGLAKAEDLLRPVAPTTRVAETQPASTITRVDLGNGTILLAKRITTSPLVVMNMYSLGGVTAEDAKTNGLGNLAMEMLPRGTKTRSAREIAEFWDSIGGDLSTACGTNSWTWSANCMTADFEKAFEAFADVVKNPAFADAELAPLKKRIDAQIQGQDADWTAQAFRFFKKSYYGPTGSPYQFTPVGPEQNVDAFTAEQVRAWYATKVMAGRKVIAVFGDIDPQQAEQVARKHLGAGDKVADAPATRSAETDVGSHDTPATKAIAAEKPHTNVTRVEVNQTNQPLAGVVIGYTSNSVIGEGATYAIDLADTLTSGYTYPTGYLHEILRGRGLVYVVHAQNSPGRNKDLPGTFLVYAGCEPDKVNEVVDVILENIARLQGTSDEINADWFKRSKEMIVVAEAMENETPVAQAQQAALDELFGLGYNWHQRFADKIRSTSLDSVRDLAKTRLADCVVTVSTPAPQQVKIKAGRREYATFAPVDLTPRGVQHDTGSAGK